MSDIMLNVFTLIIIMIIVITLIVAMLSVIILSVVVPVYYNNRKVLLFLSKDKRLTVISYENMAC